MNILHALISTVVSLGVGYVTWIVVISIADHRRYGREMERRRRDHLAVEAARAAVERADEATTPRATIPPALRAELDQTPEWWDRAFQALVRATTPRDAEYHRDHDVHDIADYTYNGYRFRTHCLDCGIDIETTQPLTDEERAHIERSILSGSWRRRGRDG